MTEGNSGTVNATFTLSLSAPSSQAVGVSYATAAGSATAPGDFTSRSGSLSFPPFATTLPLSITVNGDTLSEANETFVVNLSGASGATIADAQGTATIVNDDALPALSIGDVSVTEGNSGSLNATFTVTLSPASGQAVSVAYATANVTALAGSDYTTTSGTLNFAAGATEPDLHRPCPRQHDP